MINDYPLNDCLENGSHFYKIEGFNFILAELKGNNCFYYKCYGGRQISQSTKFCNGPVIQNYPNFKIDKISKTFLLF
jgi:hypothetical protein